MNKNRNEEEPKVVLTHNDITIYPMWSNPQTSLPLCLQGDQSTVVIMVCPWREGRVVWPICSISERLWGALSIIWLCNSARHGSDTVRTTAILPSVTTTDVSWYSAPKKLPHANLEATVLRPVRTTNSMRPARIDLSPTFNEQGTLTLKLWQA